MIKMGLKSLGLLLADAPNPCETDRLTPPTAKKKKREGGCERNSAEFSHSGQSGGSHRSIRCESNLCAVVDLRPPAESRCVFSLGSRVIHPPTNSWQRLNLALLGLVCSG